MMAVFPSAESATEVPWLAGPSAPEPTSLVPCCVHTPPFLVQTQAAPTPLLSWSPSTMAVLPSEDKATEMPCSALSTAPEPTSFDPCWVHSPPLLIQIEAAPWPKLSSTHPTMAVLPSPERDTEKPCWARPNTSVATNFGPCCENCANARGAERNVRQTRTVSAKGRSFK